MCPLLKGTKKQKPIMWLFEKQNSQNLFPRPMAHRAAPISVSIALGHASANAVKATAGGWSTSLNFPLHSHMSSARREGSEYNFLKVFGMTRPGLEPTIYRLRQTLYHWAITPVIYLKKPSSISNIYLQLPEIRSF